MKELSSKLTEKKIRRIVNLYKLLYKVEYDKVVKYLVKKRTTIKDEGKIESKYIKRALFEYPETLADMLEKSLTKDEYSYFRSKEGAQFFAKLAPEFLLIKKA